MKILKVALSVFSAVALGALLTVGTIATIVFIIRAIVDLLRLAVS